MSVGKQTHEPPIQMFVRRGATPRYEALKRKTRDLNVLVAWDRREEDRREDSEAIDADRRYQNRRKKPPFTWEMADFVVVVPKAAPKKRARKRS